MSGLKLGTDLTLPLEAVTERLGFLGRPGQGKTYAAMLLAEQMHAAGAQFIALDPVGIWHGLRLAANGKDPGLEIPVFGGLMGDLPLEAGGGKILADLIVDRGISAVIDVSQFESDADRARFSTDFAKRLFFRKKAAPSAIHLFLEEAQEFIPQNPTGTESFMLAAFTKIAKIGRNYGFGISIISQRPQEVNKKALNLVELLFAFQLTAPHERKSVTSWIEEKGVDEDIDAVLPKLKPQHPHVWSPSWLEMSRVVHIAKRWTFDASATPKVGAKAQVRPLTPIDLAKLQTDMAATIERAKAEDPKLLRARIVELERTLKSKSVPVATPPAKIETKIIEKPVITDAQIAALQKITESVAAARVTETALWDNMLHSVNALLAEARRIKHVAASGSAQLAAVREAERINRRVSASMAPATPRPATTSRVHQQRNVTRNVAADVALDGDLKMGKAERTILTVLIQHGALTNAQIALLSGYRPTASTISVSLGKLRKAGFVDPRSPVSATEEGVAFLGDDVEPLPQGPDLLEYWRHRFGGTERNVLDALIDAWPSDSSLDLVASHTGYSPNASTISVALGKLRRVGVVRKWRLDEDFARIVGLE